MDNTNAATEFSGDDRFIDLCDVERKLNRGRSWIYDRIAKDASFPRPVRMGRSVRFLEREVLAWANAVIAESRKAA